MEGGARVKSVRKYLNLTLEEFGNSVGVTKQTISRIENGVNNLTEQMAKSICREFHVSYVWLTTGDGDMFEESNLAIYDKIDEIMAGESEFHKQLIKSIVDLDDDTIKKIEKMIVDLYEAQKKDDI